MGTLGQNHIKSVQVKHIVIFRISFKLLSHGMATNNIGEIPK